jgi:hypothetical protein
LEEKKGLAPIIGGKSPYAHKIIAPLHSRFQGFHIAKTDHTEFSAWVASVLVTEGIFDALSIDGLALMHNTVSDAQARLIRSLGREVTVVPDQDRAGMDLVDRAVELGWAVSMPEWPVGCKDVNDAVICLGRVGALLTIFQARETSRIRIELRKKQLIKKISQ